MKGLVTLLFVALLLASAFGTVDVRNPKCCTSAADPACKEYVQSIYDHNLSRRGNARVVTGFIYLFITIGYVSLSVWLAVLLAWLWNPKAGCLRECTGGHAPVESQVAIRMTLFYFAILAAVVVVLTSGGLTAWMVFGFIELVSCVALSVVSVLVRRRYARVRPSSYVDTKPTHGEKWTLFPKPIGKSQIMVAVTMVILQLFLLVLVLILFYAWMPKPYVVWDRQALCQSEEYIPPVTAKALVLMYSFERWATNVRIGIYTKVTTNYCGQEFTALLTDPKDKEQRIYKNFIAKYNINMTHYIPSNYNSYTSVNDWFIRKVDAENYRKLSTAVPATQQIVSPADSRLLVYPILDDIGIWIKGDKFSVPDLLAVSSADPLANGFVGGTVAIARLAPQDYHRFNSPIGQATITEVRTVEGSYWSVSADAARSGNKPFYNLRQIVILSHPSAGKIAYVAIGATCVGSVVLTRKVGDVLNLRDELGYMQFGGSTVILLFQKGAVSLDADLVQYSRIPVESYVHVNALIGTLMR